MNLNTEFIDQIWEKVKAIVGYDSNIYRKDACGAWIMKDKEGDREHSFGWEIDHIFPKSLGGEDDIDNLRPLHWENNMSKGDSYPRYKSVITSNGSKNVYKEQWVPINAKIQEKIDHLYNNKK